MGFRNGAYAKLWNVESVSDVRAKGRISISRKNKDGEYEQDFGGFVSFLGTAAAKKASTLKEGDRIKLTSVDVSNRYDKEKDVTYTNFNIFSFETEAEMNGNQQIQQEVNKTIDDGEVDVEDDRLPF